MKSSTVLTMTLALSLTATALWADQQIKTPPATGQSLGAVTGGRFGKAQPVIEKKCISCHSAKVIEQAIASGKDMQKIQRRMEEKGVKLSANERSVLGIFWQETPLKKRK